MDKPPGLRSAPPGGNRRLPWAGMAFRLHPRRTRDGKNGKQLQMSSEDSFRAPAGAVPPALCTT